MKFVLASQGFTTPEIAQAVAELVGKAPKDISVAIINEAYTGIANGHDHRWLLEEVGNVAKNFGGTLSFVNLRAYDNAEVARRLQDADIIYIVGGTQLVLPLLFREKGLDTLLPELAKTKVVMGTSAGANVLGQSINNAAYWEDQYGPAEQYLQQPFLGFVNFNILPHWGRADHPNRTKERVEPLLIDSPFPLYGLTDEQAIISNNGTVSFVGGNPVSFGNNEQTNSLS